MCYAPDIPKWIGVMIFTILWAMSSPPHPNSKGCCCRRLQPILFALGELRLGWPMCVRGHAITHDMRLACGP